MLHCEFKYENILLENAKKNYFENFVLLLMGIFFYIYKSYKTYYTKAKHINYKDILNYDWQGNYKIMTLFLGKYKTTKRKCDTLNSKI